MNLSSGEKIVLMLYCVLAAAVIYGACWYAAMYAPSSDRSVERIDLPVLETRSPVKTVYPAEEPTHKLYYVEGWYCAAPCID